MAKASKTTSRTLAAISLEGSLLACLEPVIAVIDKDYFDDNGRPNELHAMGHELPSRKDGMLRVLLNNFARDVYQQIYGVKSPTYNFNGAKDNYDRAGQALASLESKYREAPEDLVGDPNLVRYMAWYEQAEAKMTALQSMLDDIKNVYKTVTCTDWEYVAPGTRTTKAPINPADTLAAIREKLNAKAAAIADKKTAEAMKAAPINNVA